MHFNMFNHDNPFDFVAAAVGAAKKSKFILINWIHGAEMFCMLMKNK